MQANRPIVKLIRNAFFPSKKVKRRKCPVFARTNLCPRITLPFIWSSHSQKMSDGDIIYSLFPAFYSVIRKKRNHLFFCTSNHFPVNGDTDKKANYAFCSGHDVRTVCFFISIPFFRKDFFSILPNADLTNIILIPRDIRYESVKLFFVHYCLHYIMIGCSENKTKSIKNHFQEYLS